MLYIADALHKVVEHVLADDEVLVGADLHLVVLDAGANFLAEELHHVARAVLVLAV